MTRARSDAEALRTLMHIPSVRFERQDRIEAALTLYVGQRVDFADGYLAAAATHDAVPVLSLDRDFRRLTTVRWIEP